MNKIAIITYNHPHRKTQNSVFRLKALGYENVKLFALPFIKRENPIQPIFQHRPSHCITISCKDFAKNLNYDFEVSSVEELNENLNKYSPNHILITGAGILPKNLVENHRIINSHPAYLPLVRGLDALKWAIVNKQKLGVTSHFIIDEADAGFLIDRKEIPVYKNDTFFELAMRQYELEIEMLVASIEKTKTQSNFPELPTEGKVNRRMPKNVEENLMKHFQEYKLKFGI